jgi:glycerol-3-phosphate acyltransferase PlsX
MVTIAIDAMGGDHGIPVTIPAAVSMLNKHSDLQLILVGDKPSILQALQAEQYDAARISIQHTTQKVEMDELPSHALRSKKDSSMRVAINLVKEGAAKACVSAGNTGALMATARFVLKTIPGIDRPAIISSFPTYDPNKCVRVLDLGANVDSNAECLMQFAVMGSVLAQAADNIENPKVYLLNIGEEEIKGNEQVKATAQLLAASKLVNYVGYIEADAIFNGNADVIVCDGFVGNVTLKTIEGASVFITSLMKQAFMRNWMTKLVALLVKPILKSFVKRIDPGHYNGATLLGLQGTVIKSHGGAKVFAFAHAIHEAMLEAEKNIPERILHEVQRLLNSSSPSQSE